MATNVRRLYRSRKNRILAGVCGGLGEYFSIDPTIMRVIYIILLIFTAVVPLIVLYLLLWVIVPDAPK